MTLRAAFEINQLLASRVSQTEKSALMDLGLGARRVKLVEADLIQFTGFFRNGIESGV